ncbi:MAG: hypothetical protein KDC92_07645 [Bacteroidetes bacterium]|nr:hypothetical protein [Bacteroidota bacterium]
MPKQLVIILAFIALPLLLSSQKSQKVKWINAIEWLQKQDVSDKVLLAEIAELVQVEKQQQNPILIAAGAVGAVFGVYAVIQIVRAKQKALALTEVYYPDASQDGTKGDAFRHLLVSALLRHMANRPVSNCAMVAWELKADIARTNEPRNRYMDLHNNELARVHCYRDFNRINNIDSIAFRVHQFIETDSNSRYYNWHKTPPTRKQAKKMADTTNVRKYIFWNKEEFKLDN